jgi:predicted nucleic acid-binding protein
MSRTSARANCLDASVLVKLYVDEVGSDIVREYVACEPTCYTTPICYIEALSILKTKWSKLKKPERISHEKYQDAAFKLTAWFSSVSKRVKDLDFMSPSVFRDVQVIATKYSLDISDSFQILSVKKGFFSGLAGGSKTILVTADKLLASAARQEGLRVWYCIDEPAP